MTVLAVNLKQLYQRRMLWLAYAGFAPVLLFYVVLLRGRPVRAEGQYTLPIMLNFALGTLAGLHHGEILRTSMAFCLPGHRQSVSRVIFAVGIFTSLMSVIVFLWYPGMSWNWRLLVLAAAFSTGFMFCLAGAMLPLYRRSSRIAIPLAVSLPVGGVFGLDVLLERAIIMHPVAIIGLGGLFVAAAWFRLNDANLARRSCLQPSGALTGLIDAARVHHPQARRDAVRWDRFKDHPRPWVEAFFFNRMVRSDRFSTSRFTWGSLYCSFALSLSCWRRNLVGGILLAVILGCLGFCGLSVLVLVVFIGADPIETLVYSTMAIPGGRRERFIAALVTAVAGAGLSSLFIAFMLFVSMALSLVLLNFQFRLTVSYEVIAAVALHVPLMFMPVAATTHLLFHGRPMAMAVLLMSLVGLTITSGFIWRSTLPRIAYEPVTFAIEACCWLVFALILRHIVYRRSLIR